MINRIKELFSMVEQCVLCPQCKCSAQLHVLDHVSQWEFYYASIIPA